MREVKEILGTLKLKFKANIQRTLDHTLYKDREFASPTVIGSLGPMRSSPSIYPRDDPSLVTVATISWLPASLDGEKNG